LEVFPSFAENMRKILATIFLAFFFFLFFFNRVKAEMASGQLIELYLHDKSCDNKYDCLSPFYFKIAGKGAEAVQPLLEALDNPGSLYIEHRLSFIYLLGMIGDVKAYSVLRAIFLNSKEDEDKWHPEANKWRLAISLGACLGEESIDDFVDLVIQDMTGGALRALRETSGRDFGQNKEQWVKYLKMTGQLEVFRAACRQRSVPILG